MSAPGEPRPGAARRRGVAQPARARGRVPAGGGGSRPAAAWTPPTGSLVGIVGGLVVAFGIVTIPLPGPGWLTVIAGLFVLATEFAWAERLLEFTRRHVEGWTAWLGRQPVVVRLAVALLTAAFVYGVLRRHAARHRACPHWVPGWVPLWH